jgi:hypothetical protein
MLEEARCRSRLIVAAPDGYYQRVTRPRSPRDPHRFRTDILFLGMSSPRKELFMGEWGPATKAHVLHGVGGSFDILAGQTRRAPLWLQTHGLEWLYRAWQEPIRLGRRYLKTNLAFLALVAHERIRRGAPGPGGPAAADPAPAGPAGDRASARLLAVGPRKRLPPGAAAPGERATKGLVVGPGYVGPPPRGRRRPQRHRL